MVDLLAPGTMLHGRYAIERVLRVGRRNALYLGTDAQAAVKEVVIRENLDSSPEAQAGFQQEAEALTRLEHPGLPVAIDYFAEPSGLQYLVSEQVEGLNLAESLARDGPLPQADVLSWFDRLLAAVEYLHAQQPPIVHGDISPRSIVIAVDGRPRLNALPGSYEVEESADDSAGPAANAFLAPEQHQGTVDERVDIYAIGATLYGMLTGKNPPTALARLAGEEMPSPRQLNRTISPRVEAAILKAMSLEPEERFRTPDELWTALKRPLATRSRLLPIVLGVAIAAISLLLVAMALWRLLVPLFSQPPASTRPQPTAIPPIVSTVPPTVVPPTATRRPTREPTPTPTLAPPTATATVAPTVAPTAAPVATAKPAPVSPPTSEPRLYQAPALLSPSPGGSLAGEVEFRWYWKETLAADEYFDLQVWRAGAEPAGIAWCKEPYYRAAFLPGGAGDYRWRVRVIRGAGGQVQAVLSKPSAEWPLGWRPAGQ